MTAEERLAYFQGEKRRNTSYQYIKSEKTIDRLFLKVRFLIAVILFIGFLSLDYTGYQIKGIGSEKIIYEIITDFDMNYLKNLFEAL